MRFIDKGSRKIRGVRKNELGRKREERRIEKMIEKGNDSGNDGWEEGMWNDW